jgi:hypothetical protein
MQFPDIASEQITRKISVGNQHVHFVSYARFFCCYILLSVACKMLALFFVGRVMPLGFVIVIK